MLRNGRLLARMLNCRLITLCILRIGNILVMIWRGVVVACSLRLLSLVTLVRIRLVHRPCLRGLRVGVIVLMLNGRAILLLCTLLVWRLRKLVLELLLTLLRCRRLFPRCVLTGTMVYVVLGVRRRPLVYVYRVRRARRWTLDLLLLWKMGLREMVCLLCGLIKVLT